MNDTPKTLAVGPVKVTIVPASAGVGVLVSQEFERETPTPLSVTTTCTCYEPGGASHSVTKDCPTTSATCDCSTPSSPVLTCN